MILTPDTLVGVRLFLYEVDLTLTPYALTDWMKASILLVLSAFIRFVT